MDRLTIDMLGVWQSVDTVLHDLLKGMRPRLSPFEFLLLESIADERAEGSAMKELREQLKLSRDHATKVIGKLVRLGLVQFRAGGISRRSKAIILTKLGYRRRSQIEEQLNEQFRTVLEKEDPDRLKDIGDALYLLCRLLPPTRVGRAELSLRLE